MTIEETYRDIEQTLGLVPHFLKRVDQSLLPMEWELFKRIEFGDSVIPMKYRELIGIGIAAATKCRYCSLFHTEAAKLAGATDAEIEEALQYSKNSAGWSTYLNGAQEDYELFRQELQQIGEFLKSQAKPEEVPGKAEQPTATQPGAHA